MTMEENVPGEGAEQVIDYPPVNPQDVVYQAKAVWPMVVGVISIILGSLGIISGLCGAGFMLAMEMFADKMPQIAESGALMSGNQLVVTLFLNIVNVGFAIALLTCGISMCKRRYWSASGIQWWAVLYIPYSLVSTIVISLAQYQTMQAQMESQSSSPPMMGSFMAGGMIVGVVIGLVWAWALPIFVLIWFRRESVKTEVESWT